MLLVEMMNKELIEAKIDEYLAEILINRDQEDESPRLRSPRASQDIDGFFRLVGQAIKAEQESEGVSIPLIYTEDMPENDDNIKGEIIAYSLDERRPATFEQVPQGFAMMD